MNEWPFPRIVLVLLVGAALTITLGGMMAAAGIITPVFLALVLTVTVHPMRGWLGRKGVPEWLASTIMLLVVYLILVVLILMLAVSIARLAELLPQYTTEIDERVASATKLLEDAGAGKEQTQAVASAFNVGDLVGLATDILAGVLGVLSDFLFLVLLLLFMAFDTTKTTAAFEGLRDSRSNLVESMNSFASSTRSYMVVSTVFGLIVAVIDFAVLELLGVPGAFIWAVLAFVTNFIPNIGFIIGLIPPALMALLDSGVGLMIAVILAYILINFVLQSVIQPRVVGDRVGLLPTITFFAVIFWTWVVGPMGAILAVPLTLLLRAVLLEADPGARWTLPLVTGKRDEVAPTTPTTATQP
jgi:AI-2 transport protein TqsA